jgi:hypothetical protein
VLGSSSALGGTPTAPTAGGGNNSIQIATTQFVQGALGGITSVIFTPNRPGSNYAAVGFSSSLVGTTLTITVTWHVFQIPPSQDVPE